MYLLLFAKAHYPKRITILFAFACKSRQKYSRGNALLPRYKRPYAPLNYALGGGGGGGRNQNAAVRLHRCISGNCRLVAVCENCRANDKNKRKHLRAFCGIDRKVSFVGFVCVCSFCIAAPLLFRPPKISTGKYHYTTKTANIQIPAKILVIPAPAYAGAGCGGNQLAAGRRMLRRRKPPVTRRGFYIPVILAYCGNPPFCHFAHLRVAQTAIYRRKWQTPLRRRKPPVINGRQSRR